MFVDSEFVPLKPQSDGQGFRFSGSSVCDFKEVIFA